MKQYIDLVQHVLKNGTRKENRTGIDTLSVFGYHYEIDMGDGFPLLTTKQISWKNIVIENLWFLSGKKNIDFLKKHGCKFWDPWADSDNNVPSAYGHFWRDFSGVDQISFIIDEAKRNPMSRRLVVSAWDPQNATTSKLPPCHMIWALNVQNVKCDCPCHDKAIILHSENCCENGIVKTLNLHLTQRSADIALGVPYNIAGYSLMLHLLSRFIGIKPGKFSHTLIDAHIYTSKQDKTMSEYDHVPGLIEQVNRKPKQLPLLFIDKEINKLSDIDDLMKLDTDSILKLIQIINYNHHNDIKFKVAV